MLFLFQQGLNVAIKLVFPWATEAYCLQHIAANIEKKFGREAASIYCISVRQPTKRAFNKNLSLLSNMDKGDKAKKYIYSIPLEF